MSEFGQGGRDASQEVAGGIVTAIVVNAMAGTGLLSPAYFGLIALMNIVATAILVLKMPLWGLVYTAGWIAAVILFLNAGLLSWVEILVYLVAPVAVWGLRGWMHFRENYG